MFLGAYFIIVIPSNVNDFPPALNLAYQKSGWRYNLLWCEVIRQIVESGQIMHFMLYIDDAMLQSVQKATKQTKAKNIAFDSFTSFDSDRN